MDRLCTLIALCFASFSICSSHPIPTYFGRVDQNGVLLDVKSPEYRLKIDFFDDEGLSSRMKAAYDYQTYLNVVPDLIENGAEVDVFWRSEGNESKIDFVALYCPSDDKHPRYLDYLYLNETKSTFVDGVGRFKVKLFNMRSDCELRYFYNDGIHAYLTARSNVVRFKRGASAPLQGHLALTGKPTEMRVMWTSGIGWLFFSIVILHVY